jgi:xanthine dehydrogenase accessory factor
MISAALSRRAQELAAEGIAFATSTVVRAERPTSAQVGSVALVLGDGTIEGFVGGACAEHSVREYALKAIESGEPVLLRVLPFAEAGEGGPSDADAAGEDGAVTVQNPCLSDGSIEIFLEPVVPAPRVLVVGQTPIAGAVLAIGAELGLDVIAMDGANVDPRPADLALVVAAHGQDELHALRSGLEAGIPYVGLVASRKRGAGVIGELRGDGVSKELVELIDVPAGVDIGARTPAEIALSILAAIVAVRRDHRFAPSQDAPPVPPGILSASTPELTAVDPICGMTVATMPGTPSVLHDGEVVYFCCSGCKAKFEQQRDHAAAD